VNADCFKCTKCGWLWLGKPTLRIAEIIIWCQRCRCYNWLKGMTPEEVSRG
jgi:hypothetical protein